MSETDWRELAVALAAALVYSESAELQSLKPNPTSRSVLCSVPAGQLAKHSARADAPRPETLSRARAQKMHIELTRLKLSRDEHYSLAEKVLGREVKSLTSLTESEALRVLNAARRRASERRAPQPTSNEEANAVLN